MGIIDDGKSSKSEKSSSPVPLERANSHVYPDWAAMQAYYGPIVPLPQYYNSAMASGHAPHPYMWGPQHIMPPFGAPYGPIYSHGNVYAHPGVPLGSHGYGVPTSPAVGEVLATTPLSLDTPAKSSGNTDRGLMKKLKGFDGLAMSIGSGSAESAEHSGDHMLSSSVGTEGSSDGSGGNIGMMAQIKTKRSLEGTSTPVGIDRKSESQAFTAPVMEAKVVSDKVMSSAISPSMTPALEIMKPSTVDTKPSSAVIPQATVMVPSEGWNERELKKEKRKQSNRESARRSRLRKQAESEDLAVKVEALNAENMTLKSEMNRLTDNSEKLRFENAKLLEELKLLRRGEAEGMILSKINEKMIQPISTENLLSRVNNNSSSNGRSHEEGREIFETNSNSSSRLRQLLDTKPRADAVAAS